MEIYRPKRHRDLEEIRSLAESGSTIKVSESLLNGDLAQVPTEEAQRILSLALQRSLEYTRDSIIPFTNETYSLQQRRILLIEERLFKINFRTKGLIEVVRDIFK